MKNNAAESCMTIIVIMIILGGFGAFVEAILPIIIILVILAIIAGFIIYSKNLEANKYTTGMDYVAEAYKDGKYFLIENRISGNGKNYISVNDMKSKVNHQLSNYGYSNIRVFTIDEYKQHKKQLELLKKKEQKQLEKIEQDKQLKERHLNKLFNSSCINCGASDFEKNYDSIKCSYCNSIFK